MGQHNNTLGRTGEDLAAAHYLALGYEVVARNWRSGRTGEIDLVVALDGVLVVVEVKSRSSDRFGTPAEAVDWRKQRRLRALAVAFLQAHEVRARQIRFDVVAVRGRSLDVIEAAF